MNCQRGFNITELVIAMACSLLLILGAASLTTMSVQSKVKAIGKLDSVGQNSEIKDMFFSQSSGNIATSCKDKMGLSTSHQFSPGNDFQIPVANFQNTNIGSTIDSIFLSDAKEVRAAGLNTEFVAQLRIKQRLNRGPATSLATVTLGMMSLVVSPQGKILSCNWEGDGIVNPMSVCTGSTGTVASGSLCSIAPELEVLTTCPTGTSLSDDSGRCVPINVGCSQQLLGKKFDGNKFNCSSIPPNYAVRYPAGHSPPQGDTSGQVGGGSAVQCACGNQQIPAGGTQLCIKGWSRSEGFGNYDDMWDVQRCNTAGRLEPNSPNSKVFKEVGQGINYGYKPGTCYLTGGSKNEDGVLYSLGSCG